MIRVAPLDLKAHAAIVSLALIGLTGLLGLRAYGVARSHLAETQALVNQDVGAQSLVVSMESSVQARDRAERKFQVTADRHYADLRDELQSSIAKSADDLADLLAQIYPELVPQAKAVSSVASLRELASELKQRRQEKLRHAGAEALGLSRLIGLSLLICAILTAWLIYLFYRGLIEPMNRLRAATARISEGDFSYRLKSCRGVAEVRELGSSFNSMAERIEALDRAKAEFLATVSHEIRNPLAALKEGLSFMAGQGDALTPTARDRALGACVIASKRLEAMIKNLLKLSRGETELFTYDVGVHDLVDAVSCALQEVRPLAEKRKMRFVSELPDELRGAFDWDAVVQVLENLILNAIKYGDEGSEIGVKAELLASSQLAVTVSNAGRAIPKVELSRIFDFFYRGSNAGQSKGLGIGLHVVKQIVAAHDGTVSASAEGGRTLFCFSIPRRFSEGVVQ